MYHSPTINIYPGRNTVKVDVKNESFCDSVSELVQEIQVVFYSCMLQQVFYGMLQMCTQICLGQMLDQQL